MLARVNFSFRACFGVLVPTVSRDVSMVGIIEIKALSDLFWHRLGHEAAVATSLLLGKEANGH